MRKKISGIAAAFCLAALPVAAQQQPLTDAQIVKGAEDIETPVPVPVAWEDATHYRVNKGNGMTPGTFVVDLKTGREQPYEAPADAYSVKIVNDDIYYVAAGRERRLTQTPEAEKNPTLSPDGRWVAFTRGGDLYAIRLADGREIRYTHDGTDLILNGWASWVYYEEILGRASRYRSFWWSPDSRTLAFFRADDTDVPMFPIYNSKGKHGFLERTHYPKAGDPNPRVRVGLVAVEGGKVVWADFNEKDDQYFGRPFWRPDGSQLLVQWMNRDQNNLKLYAIDPADGTKKEIYDEKQPTWIDWIGDLTWLKDGFLMVRDFDGWQQIYYHLADGRLKAQLTDGKLWNTRIVRADEKNRTVYFTSNAEIPTRTDFYAVRFDGSGMRRLTSGDYTYTNICLSPDNRRFLCCYSNVSTPTRMALIDVKNGKVKDLADAKGAAFERYQLALPEMVWMKTDDGFDLPATVIWPLHIEPGKKYPVIISIYGGPNAGTVFDSWKGIGINQWWAKEGVIQIAIDHRGSGKCGKNGLNFMHRNLGKWEMADYTAWVKWLCEKTFVDPARIGITGGSYGGYITAFALTYGSDYFKYGIANFGVMDWALYDSHYTERYMDSPADNPEGYTFNSVMTHAARYKGGDHSMLRIVHGTMDDNVHMQNSIQLIDTLQNLDKPFEFMLYPGERHGWRGAKAVHLKHDNYRFWYHYLLGREVPPILLEN